MRDGASPPIVLPGHAFKLSSYSDALLAEPGAYLWVAYLWCASFRDGEPNLTDGFLLMVLLGWVGNRMLMERLAMEVWEELGLMMKWAES